jgi:hypothetical protein
LYVNFLPPLIHQQADAKHRLRKKRVNLGEIQLPVLQATQESQTWFEIADPEDGTVRRLAIESWIVDKNGCLTDFKIMDEAPFLQQARAKFFKYFALAVTPRAKTATGELITLRQSEKGRSTIDKLHVWIAHPYLQQLLGSFSEAGNTYEVFPPFGSGGDLKLGLFVH